MTVKEENLTVLQEKPTPFLLEGGAVGILLLHGFGGTAREMRPLGEYLHARGLTVHAPLLPGHGETMAEMNRHGWREWVAGTEKAYDLLSAHCEERFVAGFSMGTLLALWIAAHHPAMAGLILYAPAFKIRNWRIWLTPLARYFVHTSAHPGESDLYNSEAEKWLGGFERYPVPAAAEMWQLRHRALHMLSHLESPTLVAYAENDLSIHSDSGPMAVRKLSRHVPVRELVLHKSGHAIIVDQEWEDVAAATFCFIQEQSKLLRG